MLQFEHCELWQGVLFTVGYGSVLAAAVAARAVHAKPWTLMTVPLYWPPQAIAMLLALIDMQHRPQFRAKTPHIGSSPTTTPQRTRPSPDNVIQLEFPFPD
jgi:hypothetical protein